MGYQESIPGATGWATVRFGVLVGTMLQISNESAKEEGMMDKQDQETYIKMCDCPEIQKQRSLDCVFNGDSSLRPSELMKYADAGDCFYHPFFGKVRYFGEENAHIQVMGGEIIWLPRQDDLQKMDGLDWFLFDKTCVTWAMTNTMYRQYSKEMVGLCVVMKEVYNKVWNGEKWE